MSDYKHSEACCKIPPVTSDYTPKGSYIDLAGIKTYAAGTGDQAIIAVYDIFGLHPSTQQGVDALATLGFSVYLPDIFRGKALEHDALLVDEAKRAEILGAFFSSTGNFEDRKNDVLAVAKALADQGKKHIGVYGLCWGGKVVTLLGSETDAPVLLSGIASLHPGQVKHEDFQTLQVPIAFFPSGDEPADEVDKSWAEVQKLPIATKSVFKFYTDMFHGWAGARAKLDSPEHAAAYVDVYNRLGHFFKQVAH